MAKRKSKKKEVINYTYSKWDRLVLRCMRYSWHDDVPEYKEPKWVGLISPIVLTIHYGIFKHLLYKITPRWLHHRCVHLSYIIKSPPALYCTDVAIFHSTFLLLGRFVETELGKVTEKDQKFHHALWGDLISVHRGYRVHFTRVHEKAIDLWLWYKEERPKLLKQERILLNNVYHDIDGYGYIFDRNQEPDYIREIRHQYKDELIKFRLEHYGEHKKILRANGHRREKTSDDVDTEKYTALNKILRSLWT